MFQAKQDPTELANRMYGSGVCAPGRKFPPLHDAAIKRPASFQFLARRHAQGRVAFLPFTRITLKGLIPQETDFTPITIGDHVRKRRLELKFTQKEAGKLIGVSQATVLHWELNHTNPPTASTPGMIRFLGYDPYPEPTSLSEQLAAVRRKKGWTIKQAARQLGVDEGTWGRWEKTGIPWERHRAIVQAFVTATSTAQASSRSVRTCQSS